LEVIDPATNAVTATIGVGDSPRGLAYTGTHVYVANSIGSSVTVIDPATNTVVTTIAIPPPSPPITAFPIGVLFDGTNIYVTNWED
jgi:YVTN family beta-propeller protein